MNATSDLLLKLFEDSFYSTFGLTFQGEMVLSNLMIFHPELATQVYIVAVLAGVLGLIVNYAIGRALSSKLVPVLEGKNVDRFEKTKNMMNKYIIFLLPITSISFLSYMVFFDGILGHFLYVMGNSMVLMFAVALTFFGGLFRMSFVRFVLITLISRFVAYYYFVFVILSQ